MNIFRVFLVGLVILAFNIKQAHSSDSKIFPEIEYQANISFENKNFVVNRDSHPINDEETIDVDILFKFDNQKNIQVVLHPRVRADLMDHSRNRYIPDEAYFLHYSDHFEFSAGLQLMSSGVSNFFNPTDVLNRRDLEGDFLNSDKLGDFMIGFKGIVDQLGPFNELTFHAILMPLFQETPLPENNTRFSLSGQASLVNFSLFDDQDSPSFGKSIGGALKISTTVGPADLSLHYYHGPDRVPGSRLIIDNLGSLRVQPFYYTIDMAGFNFEATAGNFGFHLEAAYKSTAVNARQPHQINFEENNAVPGSYTQIVPGIEYTFDNIFEKGQIRLSLEYLTELKHSSIFREFRPFKNDVFFGFRYDLNNTQSTQFQLGLVKDLGNNEMVALGEVSSKLYKELKLAVGGVFINRSDELYSPLSFFDNNSQVYTKLSYSYGGLYVKKKAEANLEYHDEKLSELNEPKGEIIVLSSNDDSDSRQSSD